MAGERASSSSMLLLACTLPLLALQATPEGFGNPRTVTLLGESSFDDYIKEHDRVFVQFCNEWSRHCKSMTPQYAKLGQLIQTRGLAVHLAYVDVGTQGALVERFAVHKLPGFRYFKHASGKNIVTEYDRDGTTPDALLQWLASREETNLDWEGLLETDVVKLGSENFTRFIQRNSRVLVNFYSPWCSHCTALAPEYEAVARNLRIDNLTTIAAKVDAIEERDLAKQFRIHSYPTMKYFANGLESSGPDARDSKGITRWLRRRANNMVQFVEVARIPTWSSDKNLAVMHFDSISKKRHSIIEKVASDLLDDTECHFAIAVPSHEDRKQNRSLMIRRNFSDPDAEFVQYRQTWSRVGIRDWIRQMSFPSIGKYDLQPEKYTPHLGSTNFLIASMVVSLSMRDDTDLKSSIEARVLKHTHTWKAKRLELAWADNDNFRHDSELMRLPDKTPQITLMSIEKGTSGIRKYVLRGRLNLASEAGILDFANKYFAGLLRPTFKSQKLPDHGAHQDFITTLVGDTFEDVAFAEQHDVFVKFYAPWCGQCHKVAPVWKQLARAVHDMGVDKMGVIVAEMDSTANECVEEVSGYPHFVLYPAVKGGARRKMREKIVLTSSKWDVAAFLDFIEGNARNLEDAEIPQLGVNYADALKLEHKSDPEAIKAESVGKCGRQDQATVACKQQ